MDKQPGFAATPATSDAPSAPLRIGTRSSPLALAQAEAVRAALGGGTLVPVTTKGDRRQDVRLSELGGKGVWTKELERALAMGEIDLAVHSLKDVESERPGGLAIAAVLPRADVRDRLIGAASIDALGAGMRLGTSSPRREAQLSRLVPGIRIVPLRGNVATRREKVARGEADATILAAAGLDRLGHQGIGAAIDTGLMLPAPGQAAIACECRAADTAVLAALAAINHADTFTAIRAERAFARTLGGSCHSPVAALAVRQDGQFLLSGQILSLGGEEMREGTCRFAAADAERAGADLALALLAGAPRSITALFGGA